MSIDNDAFVEELFLTACNEGDTYLQPEAAVELAFKQFKARRREDEQETFDICRKEIVDHLKTRWKMK